MTTSEYKYKLKQRFPKMFACTLKIEDFKKLFEHLKEINRDACKDELRILEERHETSPELFPVDKYEEHKDKVKKSYKILIGIHGKKGEYISSENVSIFDGHDFPSSVTQIRFDNNFFYESAFQKKPLASIDVIFDFTKPPLIDFVSSPSYETENASVIDIYGENSTWVDGAYDKIESFLKERRNSRNWLHRKSIYDLFLYLFIVPLSIWNLHKLDLFASTFFSKFSTVLTVGIYLYITLLIFVAFMFVFKYLRWLFPYMELQTSSKTKVGVHRFIYFTLVVGITCALAKDFLLFLLKIVF